MSASAEVAEAVARHNVRNRKMTGVLTVSALLEELDRLRKVEEAALRVVRAWEDDATIDDVFDRLRDLFAADGTP